MRLRCLLLTLLATVPCSHAEEMPEGLIDGIIAAYGGEAITNLESFMLFERYLAPATGQSHTPALENIDVVTQHVIFDIESENVRFDGLFDSRSGLSQNAVVVNGEDAWNINYRDMTFSEATNTTAYSLAGGMMRTNDALLAHRLR